MQGLTFENMHTVNSPRLHHQQQKPHYIYAAPHFFGMMAEWSSY